LLGQSKWNTKKEVRLNRNTVRKVVEIKNSKGGGRKRE